jgi:hypothetical protein
MADCGVIGSGCRAPEHRHRGARDETELRQLLLHRALHLSMRPIVAAAGSPGDSRCERNDRVEKAARLVDELASRRHGIAQDRTSEMEEMDQTSNQYECEERSRSQRHG